MRNPLHTKLGLIVLLFASLAACSKKSAESEPVPETPELAAAAPAPATPPPVAAMPPTPVPKRLAPEGTFYLLVKKSVETADGITGFKPGTLVKQEADGSFTAEGKKLEVRPNEITNDLDLAARYAGADALRQAAIRQSTSVAPPTPAASQPAASASTAGSRPPAKSSGSGIVAPTQRVGALDASSALGAGHTMTKDGWLWQKDTSGNWRRLKPLR